MKSCIISFFLIFSVVLMPVEGFAQQNRIAKVSVSTRKTSIDGVAYYLHRVQPDETLYGIANAYKVLQKDIVAANPSALTSIRVGEELKIPVQSSETYAGDALESDSFISHIAKRGQSKDELVRQYGITMEQLYQFNPELKFSSIEKGQVVKIPKPATESLEKQKGNYFIHKVAAHETLFSIVQLYGVDTNTVLQFNPSINSRTLKVKSGQELRIPVKSVPIVGIPVSAQEADTVIVRHDIPQSSQIDKRNRGKEFRVALLMPLYLSENRSSSAQASDTTLTIDPYSGGLRTREGDYWVYPGSANFLNFYEGVLLALDSLRHQGVQVDLHVYDTGKSSVLLQRILVRPEMKDMDLLIGPFYTELIEQTMSFAQEHQIYCVSPLTNNLNLITNRPYLLQVIPEQNVVNDSLVAYVTSQKDAFITLITNTDESPTRFSRWRNQLKSRIPAARFKEVPCRTSTFSASFLQEAVRNVVICFSEDEVFVGRMMAILNLASQSQNKQVELCGLSSWARYSNVDQEYLYNLRFVTSAPFFVDYNRGDVLSFLKYHRFYFGVEPVEFTPSGYNFTYLGYDIMRYFGSVLSAFGKDFGARLSDVPCSSLLTDFRFHRPAAQQGFANSGVRMLQYTPDFYLRQIRYIRQ